MDFSNLNFSNLSGPELIGMIVGVLGLIGGAAFIIKNWLNKKG